jgi:hypothetical protein
MRRRRLLARIGGGWAVGREDTGDDEAYEAATPVALSVL